MTHSFWAGGAEAYMSASRQHYDALLRELRARRSTSSDENQRITVEVEIKHVEKDFQNKMAEIESLNF